MWQWQRYRQWHRDINIQLRSKFMSPYQIHVHASNPTSYSHADIQLSTISVNRYISLSKSRPVCTKHVGIDLSISKFKGLFFQQLGTLQKLYNQEKHLWVDDKLIIIRIDRQTYGLIDLQIGICLVNKCRLIYNFDRYVDIMINGQIDKLYLLR